MILGEAVAGAALRTAAGPEERSYLSELVSRWGYPRPVSARELEEAIWVFYSDLSAIAWLEPLDDLIVPGIDLTASLAVHAIGRPGRRRELGTPEAMAMIESIARALGARKLYSLIPRALAGSGFPIEAMRRYLRIRGWQEDDLGMYKELGDRWTG